MSFTTPVLPPSVATTGATNLTTSSVTLDGELVALGTAASVTVSFEWGTASESYTEIAGSRTLTATGPFSEELTGLTPGTSYYYRARADGDGSDEGDEMRFTTAIVRPSVTTADASDVAATAATLNGDLTALGTADSVVLPSSGVPPPVHTHRPPTPKGAAPAELSPMH